MKIIKYSFSILLAFALTFFVSCDETFVNPLPEFESAVHAYGEFLSATKITTVSARKAAKDSFSVSNPARTSDFRYRWHSIDNKNTVSKIEFYVTMFETYTDKNGNQRKPSHGTKLWKVVEGSAVPANLTFTNFKISQSEVYNLFKDVSFNYGNGSVKVFEQNARTATNPFTTKDEISITWALTTADGRRFFEWSDGICGDTDSEFMNCKLNIICIR